jgi:SRSO17 transposase
MASGARFGCVLADGGYGLSAPFRQGLTARGLAWAVGIPRHLKVYPLGVKLFWPVAMRGRPRKRYIPDIVETIADELMRWKVATPRGRRRHGSTVAKLLDLLRSR